MSGGEVNFLWWFMQGSVMDAEVRARMRAAWGLCERHTAAWLLVESAFHHRYLHGPAVFYSDLMERAQRALEPARPRSMREPGCHALARRLASRAACHLCEMNMGPSSEGYIPATRLRAGRDPVPLRAFMQETERHWRAHVCRLCDGSGGSLRCRAHLCAELRSGASSDIEAQRRHVAELAHHMKRYDDSFRWEHRGSETPADRAALIGAAGWSGGWRGLLSVFGSDAATNREV